MSMHTRHNEIQERIARPCFDGTRDSARQRQYVPRIFSLHFAAMMRRIFAGSARRAIPRCRLRGSSGANKSPVLTFSV